MRLPAQLSDRPFGRVGSLQLHRRDPQRLARLASRWASLRHHHLVAWNVVLIHRDVGLRDHNVAGDPLYIVFAPEGGMRRRARRARVRTRPHRLLRRR
ncbi:MAG: hypothetical protein MZU97_10050 [Bacillus subtilis]|nr:hypothetical protein [Bacillus subtilis]